MDKCIIYPNDAGRISILAPAIDCGLSIEQVAQKDVPTGKPYLFVDRSELADLTFTDAFEADFSHPDGVGA